MNYSTPYSFEELSEALSLMTEHSVIIAGGTDWIIKHRKEYSDVDYMIYPGKIPGIDEITFEKGQLCIGAMATMSTVAAALRTVPAFAAIADAAEGMGSPQIRNKATIGGNICNASPAGDMLPIMILYDAEIEIIDYSGKHSLLPAKDFFIGSGKTVLSSRQAVIAIRISVPDQQFTVSAYHKIGSRQDVTIARESLSILLLKDSNEKIQKARVAMGAVSNVPIRVFEAEEFLAGQDLYDISEDRLTEIIACTVHENCRPKNRRYKTSAAKGLTSDLLKKLKHRY